MNDELLKQLLRQMKIMNFWVTLFGTIVVIAIITLATLIYQVVQVIDRTNTQINNVKTEISQSADVKKQVCDGDGKFAMFLRSSGVCTE